MEQDTTVLKPAVRAARRLNGLRAELASASSAASGQGKFGEQAAAVARLLLEEETNGVSRKPSRNAGDEDADALLRPEPLRNRARDFTHDIGEEVYQDDEADLLRQQREDRANIPLTAFNLSEEKAMGRFDENGGFTWRDKQGGEGDVQDAWMDSIVEKAEKQGQEEPVIDVRVRAGRRSREQKSSEEQAGKSKDFYLQNLVDLLDDGEKVLSALARFGKRDDKAKVEELTEAANRLIGDMPEVYDLTRRQIDGEVREKRVALMKSRFFEYKMSLEPGAEVHGPYSAFDLQGWRQQGYFTDAQKAFLRTVSTPKSQDSDEPSAKKRKVALEDELAADFEEEEDEEEEQDKVIAGGGASSGRGSRTAAQASTMETPGPWLAASQVKFTDVFH